MPRRVKYQDSSPETALDATTYYGGVRLQIPIFEGGLMKAEVGEARSKQRQAGLVSDLLRRQIESDVHEAFINYQTIESVLATARLQFEDAKKNFDTVEELFSEGLVPSLSLIDAEQALSFAEKELVSATWDRQVAIMRLEKAWGCWVKIINWTRWRFR
jgi:outer membrane protein